MTDSDVPVYGIDVELKAKLDGKVSAEQIDDARRWIAEVLGRDVPVLDQPTLKDGTLLLELLAAITGKTVKIQRSKMPFMQMENVAQFLLGAEKLGCPQHDLFQTIDLYENKNFGQVIMALYSVARHAHKAGLQVPLLGPKLNDRQERNFSDEQLDAGRYVPSILSQVANPGASGGTIYGIPRQAVYKP
ncbi:calponin homology domain-containing protein [Blastocladiella britannica]|nr:calponin homology domain-containing protein [Blastocladiella britannica]